MTSLTAGMPRGRAFLHALVALLLGALLVLGGAQPASAHAELLSTTPEDGAVLTEAPADVVLTFNEPVQLVEGSIRLFPGDEDPLQLDVRVVDAAVEAALPDDLADGRYALSYRVVSSDGHPIAGAITFTIGDAEGSAAAPVLETQTPGATQFVLSALTALLYLALLMFAGLLFFVRVILRGAGPADVRYGRVVRIAGLAAVTSSLLLIPVTALNVTGRPLLAALTPAVWMPGVFWPPVVAALIVLLAVVAALLLERRHGASAAALSASVLALLTPVLIGHSQLIEPRPLMVLADIGHLCAGAFWIGAVTGLILMLAPAWRDLDAPAEPLPLAQIVQRVSRFAVWSVIVLAVSGTVMGILIVGSVEALVTTGYGLTLLLKLGIVAPVIAIAAHNRRRVVPALSALPNDTMQRRQLNRTLTHEAALLVVILVITGFLSNLSPTHDHESGTSAVALSAEAQGLTVEGSLEPARIGENDITFTLRYDGEPVTPAEVIVRVSLPEQDLGPFEITATLAPETGEYTGPLAFPVGGQWQVQIIARVSTFAEPIVTVPVTIR